MQARGAFQLAEGTVALLQTIESTLDDDARLAAIEKLANSGDRDSGRVLMETFERTLWRSTKIAILRGLTHVRSERVTHFLIKIALNKLDLPMAAEAVLALGGSGDVLAGEFLLQILSRPEHPLSREAIVALANLHGFHCESELAEIFTRPDSDVSPTFRQFAIIALGLRGKPSARTFIERYLHADVANEAGNVFNSALIAAGRLGDAATLQKLRMLDTRFRFFAHQLKTTAMDRIALRSQCTIEDAVAMLLQAKNAAEIDQALQCVAEFADARSAFHLLGGEQHLELSCLVRAHLAAPEHWQEDLEFLKAHGDSISLSAKANLLRFYAHHDGPRVLSELWQSLKAMDVLQLLGRVKLADALPILACKIGMKSREESIAAINAMVGQCFMDGFSEKIVAECGALLIEKLQQAPEPAVEERLLRAVGQIQFQSPAVWQVFQQHIKDGAGIFASFYAGLGASGSEDAGRIVLKRLKKIVRDQDRAGEVKHAVMALSHLPVVPDAEILAPLAGRADLKIALLKILSQNAIAGFAELIEEALASQDFQTKLLGIAAAKYNSTEKIREILWADLKSTNVCWAGRALDSLCVGGTLFDHERLLDWLPDEEAAAKIFRSLTPEKNQNYDGVVARIDKLMQTRKEVFRDPELLTAATNLRDNLATQSFAANAALTSAPQAVIAEHAIDALLVEKLAGFARFSETVKSVLRNAEVTFSHPELFDERVDKSTVVVQYVKSIDILLQEKIGAQMFLNQSSDFLQHMQSRLLRLQLDEDTLHASQVIQQLQCGYHFTAENFPAAKVSTLARSILTGKILREQYRAVDGLRAWAVLLLLYGRSFKSRTVVFEPLFKVKVSSNGHISSIAQQLNALQDTRNNAAHRGTLLDVPHLREFRSLCFQVLNELHKVLP